MKNCHSTAAMSQVEQASQSCHRSRNSACGHSSTVTTLRQLSLACVVWLSGWCSGLCQAQATMTIAVVDAESGEPIPCRVELRDSRERPQKTRGGLNHMPWSIVDGQIVYRGKAGDYRFDVFHGPEYSSGGGGFTLDKDGEGSDVVRLPRHANLASEGYLAGDLLTKLTASEMPRWLAAEGLHTAAIVQRASDPPLTDSTTPGAAPGAASPPPAESTLPDQATLELASSPAGDGRSFTHESYYDDRPGSGLILHHWSPPSIVPPHVPSSRLLTMAKESLHGRAEIARLWARDVPLWLASGRIDTIQLLGEHLSRDGKSRVPVNQMYHPEPQQFKGPRGPGQLVENLYWQVLEAGLRIAPSAGSAVGSGSSPLGYNRVYVQLPGTLRDSTRWWEGLCSGRSFVTNGPLLRAKINDQLPGHTFHGLSNQTLRLNVALDLTVADPVEYVDVIFNGEALYHARLDEYARQGGRIPPLEISESGWMVVRVVTECEETYRLATTAPYYFEFDSRPRISKAACQMFADWLEDSIAQIKAADPKLAQASVTYYQAARQFWRERLAQATSP